MCVAKYKVEAANRVMQGGRSVTTSLFHAASTHFEIIQSHSVPHHPT